MKKSSAESIVIFHIEPQDDRQALLQELRALDSDKNTAIIVLDGQRTKVFQSPKDFHDLKMFKRQVDLPIIFVIPTGRLAHWAEANGFSVCPSLETLNTVESGKLEQLSSPPSQQLPSSPSQSLLESVESGKLEHLAASPSQSLLEPPFPLKLPPAALAEPAHDQYVQPPTISLPLPTELDDEELFSASSFKTDALEQAEPASQAPSSPFKPPVRPSFSPPPDLPSQNNSFNRQSFPFASPDWPSFSPPPALRSQKNGFNKQSLLLLILSFVVVSTALSAGLLLTQKGKVVPSHAAAAVAPAIVGHLYFLSSGQLGQMGINGVNDKVELVLSHLSPPDPGKSYYAWLRGDADRSDTVSVLLGRLTLAHGTAQLTYVDPQHNDLLANTSRFLITEEDATVQPIVPTTDTSLWRYQAAIPQIPNPHDMMNHFSLLDHLRHLLASEPMLEEHGLHGGLTLWLNRNSGKLLEWSRNAQDDWGHSNQTGLMQRQIIRVLDYLDGRSMVDRDVPPHSPWLVDPAQGSIGLLQRQAFQNPASILEELGMHMSALLSSPGVSAQQWRTASQIGIALDRVQSDLTNARDDAKQLAAFSPAQLQGPQAQSLLNDLVTQITNAYAGSSDPATGTTQPGVVWIATAMQTLATMDIQPYKA